MENGAKIAPCRCRVVIGSDMTEGARALRRPLRPRLPHHDDEIGRGVDPARDLPRHHLLHPHHPRVVRRPVQVAVERGPHSTICRRPPGTRSAAPSPPARPKAMDQQRQPQRPRREWTPHTSAHTPHPRPPALTAGTPPPARQASTGATNSERINPPQVAPRIPVNTSCNDTSPSSSWEGPLEGALSGLRTSSPKRRRLR